jgi:hypothetical protein
VPESPTNILLSSQTIAENNAINAVIGTLSAVGDSCTYSIISATSPTGGSTSYVSRFNINGNQLRASVSFDREDKASYTLRIRATTPFNLTYDKDFTILIANVDEFAPRFIAFDYVATSFRWLAPGGIIAHVEVYDYDFGSGGITAQHRIDLGYRFGVVGGATITFINSSTTHFKQINNSNDWPPFFLTQLANGIWAIQKNPDVPIDYMQDWYGGNGTDYAYFNLRASYTTTYSASNYYVQDVYLDLK